MANNKGLFNLEGIDGKGDNDILNVNINESGNVEFGSTNPATNPTVDFDSSATGAKDINVPVPGGDKETPTAKPAGGESGITIPGGNGETPTGKPYDASSISIPSKTTLTSDQYNAALAALKKSFKEGAEVIEMLEGTNVVNQTLDELQQQYTESALEDALLAAYENGPIFEAVKRDDKDDVKAIVLKIRKEMAKELKKDKITFYQPKVIIRLLLGEVSAIQQIWNNRLWQVLGVMHSEEGNVNNIAAKLTETFKEDLGEYKILSVKTYPAIYDMFKLKFGWKTNKDAYFLIVDKKLPSEIKAAQKEISDAIGDAGTDTKKKDEE